MGFHRGPKPVTDGLVLYLDAVNEKSYTSGSTVWKDLSGNENHAYLSGSFNYMKFNDSYFDYKPDGHFGAPAPSSGSSIESGSFWFVESDQSLDPTVTEEWTVCGWMDIAGSQSSNGVGWFAMHSDLDIHLEPIRDDFRASDSNDWGAIYDTVSSYHFSFHYYSFSYKQLSGDYGVGSGSLSFYIDGEHIATNDNYVPDIPSSYDINLGRRNGHLRHFLSGSVSTYQYYNKSLSQQEVKQNFNAQKGRFGI